jgi:hypothetical protein
MNFFAPDTNAKNVIYFSFITIVDIKKGLFLPTNYDLSY